MYSTVLCTHECDKVKMSGLTHLYQKAQVGFVVRAETTVSHSVAPRWAVSSLFTEHSSAAVLPSPFSQVPFLSFSPLSLSLSLVIVAYITLEFGLYF